MVHLLSCWKQFGFLLSAWVISYNSNRCWYEPLIEFPNIGQIINHADVYKAPLLLVFTLIHPCLLASLWLNCLHWCLQHTVPIKQDSEDFKKKTAMEWLCMHRLLMQVVMWLSALHLKEMLISKPLIASNNCKHNAHHEHHTVRKQWFSVSSDAS